MVGEEFARIWAWTERHRRLVSRLAITVLLTLAVDVVGALLTYRFEHRVKRGDIHTLGDAFFFSTVQLLTVSSQIRNPFTTAGRIVDVGLEVWAVFVVTAVAGAFASFFMSADS